MTRVYANTFCESFPFDVLLCSSALVPCTVAMLNAREVLKEELQIESVITSSFEVYNHNSFQILRKEANVENDVTEAPSSSFGLATDSLVPPSFATPSLLALFRTVLAVSCSSLHLFWDENIKKKGG